LWTCHNSKHFDFECATNWRICKWQIGAFFWRLTYFSLPKKRLMLFVF
jgi:hypothetical protein